MGRLLKLLFSRLAIVAALMLVQVGVLVYFGSSYAYFQAVSVALSIVAIIYIINQNISPAYKIAWILPIAFLPVFGIPLYILFAKKPLPERKKQRLLGMLRRYGEAMRSVHSDSVELASEDVDAAMDARRSRACSRGRTRSFSPPASGSMRPCWTSCAGRSATFSWSTTSSSPA